METPPAPPGWSDTPTDLGAVLADERTQVGVFLETLSGLKGILVGFNYEFFDSFTLLAATFGVNRLERQPAPSTQTLPALDIADSPHMSYKSRFRRHQRLIDGKRTSFD